MSALLKIVEGPNRGAEIALVDDVAVTLGKSDDCDIVLADMTLPDSPLSIESTAGGVIVDGAAIEPFHVKTVGATSFAIGPSDAPWGELVWPAIVKSDGGAAQEAGKEAGKPSDARDEKKDAAADANKDGKRRGLLVACVATLLVLLLLLLALGWLFRGKVAEIVHVGPGASGAIEVTGPDSGASGGPGLALTVIAAKYGLTVTNTPGGSVALYGNFPTRRERLAATAEAYGAKPGVELDFSDDESFRASAEDALFALTEGAIKVVVATNRVLSISGEADSPDDLKRTLEALGEDMPKVRGVNASGVKLLSSVPFPSPVAQTGTARTSRGVRPAVRSSAARARQAIAAQGPALPEMPVCGILVSPYPCLVMRDGSRVLEGSTIGGSTILEISADSVTLTNSMGRLVWKP